MADLTGTIALFSAALAICFYSQTHAQISLGLTKDWGKGIGNLLSEFVKNTTRFQDLKKAYDDGLKAGSFSLEEKNGTAMALAMKRQLEDTLGNKIQSIQILANRAEELNFNYTDDKKISLKKYKFYDSKFIDSEDKNLTLAEEATFASIPVNLTYSTVHVPTDVFNGSQTILNSAKWTEGIDQYFRENMEREPSLLWQSLGTSAGIYRAYPGYKWRIPNDKDMFDHRRRGWYIQGSSSPKDMVILLDLSGSMTGSKIAIVKLSATYLLDTLQENDFVNIVVFNKDAYMLCEYILKLEVDTKKKSGINVGNCNDTLLQATRQNLDYLKNLVKGVAAQEVANVDKGFEKAVTLLKSVRGDNQTSAGCIQTINFFTDGVEAVVAEKTNEYLDKPEVKALGIRVFGYLLGREKGSPYKPVQEFACRNKGFFYTIETLSDVRENVSKYLDVLSRPLALKKEYTPTWTPIYLDQLGLGLMITVVAPIFDRRNNNQLLGVVGTDVALPQLTGSIPFHEVGVNGFGFAINNNGFIVFHPMIKIEGNPPNLALSDVEMSTDPMLEELSRQMIDRATGNMTLKNRRVSKDLKRVSSEKTYKIYYTDINGTSFSSGVAVPLSSWYKLKFKIPTITRGKVEKLKPSSKGETVMIAPWKICDGIVPKASASSPRYIPLYADVEDLLANLTLENVGKANQLCEGPLLANLLFDAKATQDVANEWQVVVNDTRGIISVFVGTHGGLVRALYPGQDASPVSRDITRELLYQRAADFEEGTVIVSAPYKHPYSRNDDDVVLNISMPIKLKQGDKTVVAAVVGMQIKDDVLQAFLFDKRISADPADYKCTDNDTYACYLIDEDGFVVASNQETSKEEVGKSFGAVRGKVMEKMVNESLFKRFYFDDVQATCSEQSNSGSGAMRLLNPLLAVSSYAIWFTQTLFWTLVQFNIFNLFSGKSQVLAEEDSSLSPCTQRIPFFKADPAKILKGYDPPNLKSLDCDNKDSCLKFFFANQVPKTNLMLVVVKRCNCPKTKINTLPVQVESKPFTPPDERYRRLPQLKCYAYNETESKACGSGSSVTPVKFLLAVLPLVFLLFNH